MNEKMKYDVDMKKILTYTFWALILSIFHAAPVLAVSAEDELAYRVRFSKAEDVALLLKKGADPNALSNVGLPMVSVAASRTDEDAIPVLKTLIDHGADVNRGGMNNQYPIIIAARENNEDMMRYLVFEAKADYGVRDLNGLLPLEIAEYYGSEKVVGMIKELTEKKLAEEAWLKSDERRLKLMEELGQSYCKNQYMHFIYQSGQEKRSKEFITKETERFRQELQGQLYELKKYFGVPYEYAAVLKEQISDVLKAEFSAMISNRERKRRGVGTEKDIKERCGRIAGAWYKSYLEKQASMTR